MAVDMFIKLEGIKGESKDDKNKEWIDVLAWSWGASQSGTAHQGGGQGAGKVTVQDISITKYVDKASATLLQYCFSGKHITKGELKVRKAGDKPLDYINIEIKDAIITHVATGGSGGEDRLTENITINFGHVNYKYTTQAQDGSAGPDIQFKWDIPANASK